jgi:3-deoxy-7-phosphoheptulonate synthase
LKNSNTAVRLSDGVAVGGKELTVIAGPCGIESLEQLMQAALGVQKAGAKMLRGSIFKPRTSPYEYQGIGLPGLEIIEQVKEETGILVETEVMHPDHVKLVEPFVDAVRIGTRNMQNYELLREVGRQCRKPVILKRGMWSTITEWLLAAEYVMSEGNPKVILCERGIRTFVPETRNTLDLNAVALAKQLSHLPVIVDPSHGTGVRSLVAPMSLAAIAAGADGLLVEVHPNPQAALSDADQQLTIGEFERLMASAGNIAAAMGRPFGDWE